MFQVPENKGVWAQLGPLAKPPFVCFDQAASSASSGACDAQELKLQALLGTRGLGDKGEMSKLPFFLTPFFFL